MRPVASTDTGVVRVVAAVRLACAISVAMAGSFIPHMHGRRAALMLVVGLVWIPWATALLFASEGDASSAVSVAGPIGDLLILAVAQSIFPAANEAILIGYLVVVVFAVYTVAQPVAAALGAGAIALSWISQLFVVRHDRVSAAVIVSFTFAVVATILLLERTALIRTREATRYAWLQTKAETILAHVADAVVVTDGSGTVTQCNPAAERIVGRSDRTIIGTGCADALGLHRGERALDCTTGCGLLALAPIAEVGLGLEVWRRHPAGPRQPLLASATLVESADGRYEVVHSIRDITRLKQAEEAKTLFLATATHELKTPLTVINGFAETLSAYEDLDDATRAAALDAIRIRAMELTRIVDRLLLSSRIEAGRLELPLGPVDARSIVAERVATFASARGRSISCEASDEVPQVIANTDALETVIDHLVDNAIKYSADGSPIRVSVTPLDHGVEVAVADRGIGMAPDEAEHCFDKFWQAESTDVRRFGGTGIGLYVVQSLVEAMRGSISVQSARGEGSTFIVRLGLGVPAPPPQPGKGEATSIREFMRQIGVPDRRAG